ncbi:MAG TPA: VanZ family protein [Thermoanaerobaculia bacterium]
MLITVPRPVTILLLLAVTVMIAFVTVYAAGKSYSKIDPVPFEDLRHLSHRIAQKPVSTQLVAVVVMPIVANVLLFIPWGFLTFISLYTLERPTMQTYVLTILGGLSFSLAIEAWQYFLPTRVADVNDVIWNTTGAALGAIVGHLRQRVRLEFE